MKIIKFLFLISCSSIFILFYPILAVSDESNELKNFKHIPNSLLNLNTPLFDTKLLPTPGAASAQNSEFGTGVAIDGNLAVIGAPNTSAVGVAYIFEYNGTEWIEKQLLRPDDGQDILNFGYHVSIFGTTVLISAPVVTDEYNIGAAFIFELVGESWVQTKKLEPIANWSHFFGLSTSLTADYAFVGGNSDNMRTLFIFKKISDNWVQTAKLTSNNQQFAQSVSALNNRVVVGALESSYIFDLINDEWILTEEIKPSDLDVTFGTPVSLSIDRTLIGAQNSAYIFDLINGEWIESSKILPDTNVIPSNLFGQSSLSVVGDRAFIGAHKFRSNGLWSGIVYVFDLIERSWLANGNIVSNDIDQFDEFGFSIGNSATNLIIGSRTKAGLHTGQGAAYIFNQSTNGDINQTDKLLAKDGAGNSLFGSSLSVNANRMAVSAPGSNINLSVYMYEYRYPNWNLIDKIEKPNGTAFAASISLNNNRLVVGAPQDVNQNNIKSGVVYVYDYINGNWVQTAKLFNANGVHNDGFGRVVNQSENRIIITQLSSNTFANGLVYIYNLINSNWVLTSTIEADIDDTDSFFGKSIKIIDDRLLISAAASDNLSGSVYVFNYINNIWIKTAKLRSDDVVAGDFFGASIDFLANKNRLLVGASRTLNSKGVVYVYEFINNEWIETSKLNGSDSVRDDLFGGSLSQTDDLIVIGSPSANNQSGATYFYKKHENVWTEVDKVEAIDATSRDFFGSSINILNDKVIIGSPRDDESGNESGSIYIYSLISDLIFNNGFDENE